MMITTKELIGRLIFRVSILASVGCVGLTFPALASIPATSFELQPPQTLWQGETWVWRLPILHYLTGVMAGFILGTLFITLMSWRATLATNTKPSQFIKTLIKNPFFWMSCLLLGVIAGMATSGMFEIVKEYSWQKVSALSSAGLTGSGPVLVGGILAFLAKRLTGWTDSINSALAGDMDALNRIMTSSGSSNWFSVLILSRHQQARQKKIYQLSSTYETGLIQRVMWQLVNARIDKGGMEPQKREVLKQELMAIEPELNDRGKFIASRKAILHALKLINIEQLQLLLEQGERRKSGERRTKQSDTSQQTQQRSSNVRRIGSQWHPQTLVDEVA